jgi:replication factor C subunit 2/4
LLVDNSSVNVAMASFFDLKARKEAAVANGASSSKAPPPKENNRLQPWVEK